MQTEPEIMPILQHQTSQTDKLPEPTSSVQESNIIKEKEFKISPQPIIESPKSDNSEKLKSLTAEYEQKLKDMEDSYVKIYSSPK